MDRRDFLGLSGSMILGSRVVTALAFENPEGYASTGLSEMVLIPAGDFMMGHYSTGDHHPQHRVVLSSFKIDRYEVSNAQYQAFCEVTERKLPEFWGMDRYHSGPGYPNHPVVGVSWLDALDYATWAGKRLPTEAEWEYAARGGLPGKKHPHGDDLSPAFGNYVKSALGGPVEVGSYAANGYRLYDMMGNVVEWVNDRYAADYYDQSPAENPKGPEDGRFRVVRGGGWHSGPSCATVYYRNALPSNWLDIAVGFRCVKDI